MPKPTAEARRSARGLRLGEPPLRLFHGSELREQAIVITIKMLRRLEIIHAAKRPRSGLLSSRPSSFRFATSGQRTHTY